MPRDDEDFWLIYQGRVCDRNFRAAVFDGNNRVCWGPLQYKTDPEALI